ncbi:MAG: FtsQ-type POTRA domain-containing protein [Candidatus Eremiobacteraeota bacterium]|nr:FtsQ-type POTRA domain-containing protein [Candidatus Eremiobacteraeota bacterium]
MIRRRGFFEYKRILVIMLGILIIAQLIFLGSEVFSLKDVEVEGNRKMGKNEIVAAANIKFGVNAFLFKSKIAEDNLTSLPGIKTARVKVDFPSKIKIKVEERTPCLIAAKSQNSIDWYGVDHEGIVIEKNPLETIDTMPLLVIGKDIKVGDSIPAKHIEIFSRLISMMFPEELERIKWIKIDSKKGLSYNYYSSIFGEIIIHIGEPEDLECKFEFLRKYLELEGKKGEKERQQIQLIDLSCVPPFMKPEVKLSGGKNPGRTNEPGKTGK